MSFKAPDSFETIEMYLWSGDRHACEYLSPVGGWSIVLRSTSSRSFPIFVLLFVVFSIISIVKNEYF